MSNTAALRQTTRPGVPKRESTRPVLRVIEGHAAPRSAYPVIIAIVVVLVAVFAFHLYIRTQMASTAYELRDMRTELVQLNETKDSLQHRLQVVSSAGELEKQAAKNGMVHAGPTGYVTLSTGKVEGGTPAAENAEDKD
ncbi:hypothetical protein QS713_08460 [Gleimia hominis]|uniref:Cell division protein FtsL n=1 Tax=Gleimia hominis TaxID=595468 RepID=A0ABU3ICI2_9ACTO|nr:hypothetical protein [Gleimia hominis]MDT3768088.1 hypothetical protein [Gleimia hominis]